MTSMSGHSGHNMSAMGNHSIVATTMAMLLTNMSMGPDMLHHNHSSHVSVMPNITSHGDDGHMGHHSNTTNNGSTMDHNHSDHMHHNSSLDSGNHTIHDHETNDSHHHDGTHDHGSASTGATDTHDGHTETGDGSSHSGHTTGHNMVFNFDLPVHIIFSGWKATSQGQLAGACIAWFILAILHEGLRNAREFLLRKSSNSDKTCRSKAGSNDSNGDKNSQSSQKSCWDRMFNKWHIILSFLQIIQTTLGMFLMLVYMTFNVYLGIAVSLGAGVGYWLFAWNRTPTSQFDEDHCV